jgi:hypothetical protein
LTRNGHSSTKDVASEPSWGSGVTYKFGRVLVTGAPEQPGRFRGLARPAGGWLPGKGIEVKGCGRVPAELVVKFKAATSQ